jgi:hypothetical protein
MYEYKDAFLLHYLSFNLKPIRGGGDYNLLKLSTFMDLSSHLLSPDLSQGLAQEY